MYKFELFISSLFSNVVCFWVVVVCDTTYLIEGINIGGVVILGNCVLDIMFLFILNLYILKIINGTLLKKKRKKEESYHKNLFHVLYLL